MLEPPDAVRPTGYIGWRRRRGSAGGLIVTITRGVLALLFAAGALPMLLAAQSAQTVGSPDWVKASPPFRLIGNVYWVGTYDLSTYLITTPAGHILINTGLAKTVPQITVGIELLGFNVEDVKVLTATHGHFDHVAGLAQLKRLTKAQMVMSEADAELLESGGKTDFRWGDDLGARFEPVTVDRRLKDGDTIALGGVVVTAHHHPGHTKGATSFTLDVREDGRTYKVGIMNMASINPGVRLRGMPTYPTIGDDYARTFQKQKALVLDVFLASHAAQFRMHEKFKPGDAYRADRFVDPAGYRAAVERLETAYRDQMAKEKP
jgi:metallo-beta-lactamase class B